MKDTIRLTRTLMASLILDIDQRSANWRKAACAAVVVGQYQNGATAEMARRWARSVDTVEKYARAMAAWCALVAYFRTGSESGTAMRRALRNARRQFDITHLMVIADTLANYEPDPQELAADVLEAARNHVPPGQLRANLTAVYGEQKVQSATLLDVERWAVRQGLVVSEMLGWDIPRGVRLELKRAAAACKRVYQKAKA